MDIKQFLPSILLLCLSTVLQAKIQDSEIFLADPYILLEDGIYYAYGTESDSGINCFIQSHLLEMKN